MTTATHPRLRAELPPVDIADRKPRLKCPACRRTVIVEAYGMVNGCMPFHAHCAYCDWAQHVHVGPDGVARTVEEEYVPPPQPPAKSPPQNVNSEHSSKDGETMTTQANAGKRRAPVICKIDGCERRHAAHGLCTTHYGWWVKAGKPADVDAFARDPVAPAGVRRQARKKQPPEPAPEPAPTQSSEPPPEPMTESTPGPEIFNLPEVADPDRRKRCRRDFRLFCETYCPDRFTQPWTDDQLVLISDIEQAALEGGLFAKGMASASGKSTLIETAALWVQLYSHRTFVVVIGREQSNAEAIVAKIQIELQHNHRLCEDFPEICIPMRRLDRIPNHGRVRFILPKPDGDDRNRIRIVKARGVTGDLRGMQHTLADGTVVRPDFVLIDDPQSDASARSLTESARREKVLCDEVVGLFAPGKPRAAVAAMTVIARGDLADRLLDRRRHPNWNGDRCQTAPEPSAEPAPQAAPQLPAARYRQAYDDGDLDTILALRQRAIEQARSMVGQFDDLMTIDRHLAIDLANALVMRTERDGEQQGIGA